MKNAVLIAGYYGYGNAGDEYLLKKTITLIKECWQNAKICVLYPKKSPVIHKHFPLAAAHFNKPFQKSSLTYLSFCPRFSLIKVVAAMLKSDCVLFGGGGLFQDSSSKRSIFYYLFLYQLAVLFKKPVYLVSQGIGPIKSRVAKWLFSKLLKKTIPNRISVRDQESLNVIQSLSSFQPVLSSDLAYFKYNPSFKDPHENELPAIGISLRTITSRAPWISSLETFFQKVNEPLVFLDFYHKQDSDFFKKNTSLFSNFEASLDMNKVLVEQEHVPYSIQLVIGMRYHACVWASLNHIPFLALAHDPKLIELAKDLKQEYLDFNSPDFSADSLINTMTKIQKNLTKYKKNLLTNLPGLIKRAHLNTEILKK
ncbi:polysaccharide pyruvyl transferase family protein [Thermoproteota archaeon]